jgi:hypothetical protein
MAIAAMIRMMATTISSSMSEKPFCFRISFFPFLNLFLGSCCYRMTQSDLILALDWPSQPVTLGVDRNAAIPFVSV